MSDLVAIDKETLTEILMRAGVDLYASTGPTLVEAHEAVFYVNRIASPSAPDAVTTFSIELASSSAPDVGTTYRAATSTDDCDCGAPPESCGDWESCYCVDCRDDRASRDCCS